MKTPSTTIRLAAAAASFVVTITLFSAVVANAEPPMAGSLLAQAAASNVTVVR